jgi:hypothetical protein
MILKYVWLTSRIYYVLILMDDNYLLTEQIIWFGTCPNFTVDHDLYAVLTNGSRLRASKQNTSGDRKLKPSWCSSNQHSQSEHGWNISQY